MKEVIGWMLIWTPFIALYIYELIKILNKLYSDDLTKKEAFQIFIICIGFFVSVSLGTFLTTY